MSKTPNFDAKIKPILDDLQPGERTCSMTGEKWNMTEEEIGWYKKFNVPPSGYAPKGNWMNVIYFTTGYQWWWHKHPETGKPVLSYHHPATGVKVLPDVEWFDRDFSTISQDVDLSKSVFATLRELELEVPLIATSSMIPSENSVALCSFGDQNSYFTLACRGKNNFFASLLLDGEDSSDVIISNSVAQSHNVVWSARVHKCSYVRMSFGCMGSDFLFDCQDCESCFGATNQRHKKFLWFNEELSESEWKKRRADVDLASRSEVEHWKEKFDELLRTDSIWPENFNEKVEDCSGEYLFQSTRCTHCYDLDRSEDNFWVGFGAETKGSAFTLGTFNASDCYMSMTPTRGSGLKFCWRSVDCMNCEYCLFCYNCEDCFGCVGLNRKRFHIFNKSYSEEDYWKKLDEIKCAMLERGEYGKFLPLSMSTAYLPYGGAKIYMLFSEEELKNAGALSFGQCDANACGLDELATDSAQMRSLREIPDRLEDLDDSWVNKTIFDPEIGRRYAFLKPEIQHYRRLGIAPPNRHFLARNLELFRQIQSATFEDRTCGICQKRIITSVNQSYPDRVVYCRPCYQHYLESR